MLILQWILTVIARSTGKILNTAFGWAIQMLFGRVAQNRQMYMSAIAFGSVVWLALLTGVIYPPFGVWLLTFIPLPRWVNAEWVRLGMLLGAIALPPMIGGVSRLLQEPEARSRGKSALWEAVSRGYVYCLGIAITLLMLMLFTPLFRLRALLKRWTTQYIPVLIVPEDYTEVVEAIHNALKDSGWQLERRQTTALLRSPMSMLAFFTQNEGQRLMAEQMTTLTCDTLEIVVHPSYLAMISQEKDIAPVRALVVERLTFSKAHLTWEKEAMDLEDRLETLWRQIEEEKSGQALTEAGYELKAIEKDIQKLNIPYEEWEVLHRIKLSVERELYRAINGVPTYAEQKGEAFALPPYRKSEDEEVPVWSLLARPGNLLVFAIVAGIAWLKSPQRYSNK